MLGIHELSNRTGLTVRFIRKCQNCLGDILDSHVKKGDKNRLLFGDTAIALFDEIKRLKDNGLSVTAIKTSLEKQLEQGEKDRSSTVQTSFKHRSNSAETEETAALFERIIEIEKSHAQERLKWEKERSEKDQALVEKDHALKILKNELKFLPKGKTIQNLNEEFLNKQEELLEQERRRSERQRILSELKNTGFFAFKRKQELLDELEKLN